MSKTPKNKNPKSKPKKKNPKPKTDTPPTLSSVSVVDQVNLDDPEINTENIDKHLSDLADSMDEPDELEIATDNIEQPALQDTQAESDNPPPTSANPTGDTSPAPSDEDDEAQVDQALLKLEDELNDLVKEDPDVGDQENSEQPTEQPVQKDAATEQDIDNLLDQMSEALHDPDEPPTQSESASTTKAQADIQEEEQVEPASIAQQETDSPVQAQSDSQDIQQDVLEDGERKNGGGFSLPARLLVKFLRAVNKPFGFVNETTRGIIGLVAVITFMMTMITVALLLLAS